MTVFVGRSPEFGGFTPVQTVPRIEPDTKVKPAPPSLPGEEENLPKFKGTPPEEPPTEFNPRLHEKGPESIQPQKDVPMSRSESILKAFTTDSLFNRGPVVPDEFLRRVLPTPDFPRITSVNSGTFTGASTTAVFDGAISGDYVIVLVNTEELEVNFTVNGTNLTSEATDVLGVGASPLCSCEIHYFSATGVCTSVDISGLTGGNNSCYQIIVVGNANSLHRAALEGNGSGTSVRFGDETLGKTVTGNGFAPSIIIPAYFAGSTSVCNTPYGFTGKDTITNTVSITTWQKKLSVETYDTDLTLGPDQGWGATTIMLQN